MAQRRVGCLDFCPGDERLLTSLGGRIQYGLQEGLHLGVAQQGSASRVGDGQCVARWPFQTAHTQKIFALVSPTDTSDTGSNGKTGHSRSKPA